METPEEDSAPAISGAASIAEEYDWTESLQRTANGRLLANLANLVEILTWSPEWDGVIALDEFSGRIVKRRTPPYAGTGIGEWSDDDDIGLRWWLQKNADYRMAPREADIVGAVQRVARLNSFHEVRQFLDELVWDGTPRAHSLFWKYFGAQKSAYIESVAVKWLVGAIARAYAPIGGVKMDNVLILEGPQGSFKSSALAVLGAPWFTDAPFRLNDREGWMVIRGRWIVELPELDALSRAEASASKTFFGVQVDRYRTPWGRRPVDVPRQCVFCGTVNHSVYLKDETGNRRYWPVRCGQISLDLLREDRMQLWAEALHLYRQGETWWVTSAQREMYEEQQGERFIGDAWIDIISRYLESNPDIAEIDTARLFKDALGLDASKMTRAEQTRVGQIMADFSKWERKKVSRDGARAYAYSRRPTYDEVRQGGTQVGQASAIGAVPPVPPVPR
jgi:predicted P-loop ATPase